MTTNSCAALACSLADKCSHLNLCAKLTCEYFLVDFSWYLTNTILGITNICGFAFSNTFVELCKLPNMTFFTCFLKNFQAILNCVFLDLCDCRVHHHCDVLNASFIIISSWRLPCGGNGYWEMTSIVLGHLSCPLLSVNPCCVISSRII